jgi:hypothetical protein
MYPDEHSPTSNLIEDLIEIEKREAERQEIRMYEIIRNEEDSDVYHPVPAEAVIDEKTEFDSHGFYKSRFQNTS